MILLKDSEIMDSRFEKSLTVLSIGSCGRLSQIKIARSPQ